MDISEKIQLAIKHYNEKNLQQAEYFLKEILNEQPDNADILHFLGIIYAQLGHNDLAIQYLQMSLKFSTANADTYLALGHAYTLQGQFDEANSCIQKALQINPALTAHFDTAMQEELESFWGEILGKIIGIIHVGANVGQESKLYAKYGLNVIWIEPISDVFDKLKNHIASYPNQKAFRYLITDVDDKEYQFHISNNEGHSSSIYDFAGHREIWPNVTYTKTIPMKSITLSSFVKKEQLDMTKYNTLVLDTQGSELLVLKGAISLLSHIKYVKVEVADFESYAGCCQLKDMETFFRDYNFIRILKRKFAYKEGTGSYYDVLYTSRS